MPLPPFCAPPASSSPSRLCSVDESVPSHVVADTGWPTLPWAFLIPSKILRSRFTGFRRCLWMDVRSASAAPCPSRSCLLQQARSPRPFPNTDTVRHRDREYASLRCPPRRRDPSRYEPPSTANAVLVGRHVHRGQAASSLTPGGLASLAGCASSRCCHRHRQARALRPSDTRRYRSVRAPRLIAVAGEG